MFNPDEIRTAFNQQHPGHGGPQWLRLNLSTGPVLARRNVAHHSSPIYLVVINQGMCRHWMVTLKRQLKSNGSTSVPFDLYAEWVRLIGFTQQEYERAKQSTQRMAFTEQRIELYEGVTAK